MNRRYWDRLAARFDDEVFNTTTCDRNHVILRAIRRHADPDATALDLGCGTGRWIPVLAGHFRQVLAVDFSPACLRVARDSNRHLSNVRYRCADVTDPRARLPTADLVVSINVVMMPDTRRRARALTVLRRRVKPAGRALVVVPALESARLAARRLRQWRGPSAAPPARRSRENPDHGLVDAGGTVTKHYLREELATLLAKVGFADLSFRKVTYGWDTEFENPPAWLRSPYPWDWLVTARPA